MYLRVSRYPSWNVKVCTTKHFIMVCLDRAHLCGKIATNLTLNGYAIYWVIEVGGAKCDVKDIHKFKTCVHVKNTMIYSHCVVKGRTGRVWSTKSHAKTATRSMWGKLSEPWMQKHKQLSCQKIWPTENGIAVHVEQADPTACISTLQDPPSHPANASPRNPAVAPSCSTIWPGHRPMEGCGSHSHTVSSSHSFSNSTILSSRSPPLKISYYNARSLLPKLDELILLVTTNVYYPDFICITETWLSTDIMDCEVAIPGFQVCWLDRDRHGGGVLLYIRDVYHYTLIPGPNSNLEVLTVTVQHNTVPTRICLSSTVHQVLPPPFWMTFVSIWNLLTLPSSLTSSLWVISILMCLHVPIHCIQNFAAWCLRTLCSRLWMTPLIFIIMAPPVPLIYCWRLIQN